jgi:poly(hydroxyalkanoate) depolymerase family esterase
MDQHRMIEATRLIRQGRLAEATALLRSGHGGDLGDGGTVSPPRNGLHLPHGGQLLGRPRRAAGRTAGLDAPPLDGLSLPNHLRSVFPPRPAGGKPAPAAPGEFLDFAYGRGSDERFYKLYVPTGYTGQPVPLIVMLHGGTQNADDFAAGTGMNDLAERHTFLVAYPQQSRTANPMGYWNWFQPADQSRGGGEPAIIAGITAQVADTYAVDPGGVGVAGFSAGGAMAAVVAAAYPDVFAAAGVHSGLPAGSAYDVPSAFAAMREGAARPTATSIPLIVFHGDADPTVDPVNADCLVRAGAPATGRPPVTVTQHVPGGHRYTRTVHRDDEGTPVVEHWTIHGAGHAWSGGRLDGSYTDPQGPDASAELVRFLAEHARSRTPAGGGPERL